MISQQEVINSRRLIDALDIGGEFSLKELIEAVEKHRGRQIICLPTPELDYDAEVCGLVVSSPSPESTLDVIFHAASLSPWHREHTIAHELGHLMAEHTQTASALPEALVNRLRPLLEARYHAPLVGRMLGRSRFDSAEEREAELFATLVLASRKAVTDEDSQIANVLQPNRSHGRGVAP